MDKYTALIIAIGITSLVGNIVKLGIHAQWCNTSFVKNYKDNESNAKKTLLSLGKEAKTLLEKKEDLKTIDRAINELKKQVPLWKNPENFEKLHKEFQNKLNQIKDKLKINKTDSALQVVLTSKQMHDLVDSIDLSIKSLEKSTAYTDKIQQAKNFRELLKDFSGLLVDWMEMTGTSCNSITTKINQMLNSSKEPSEQDLSLSGSFNVNAATIDVANNEEGWSRALEKCITLEDCFTLIHQNILPLISRATNSINFEMLEQFPDLLKNLHESLLEMSFKASLISVDFNYPEIVMHYNISLENHSALTNVNFNCLNKKTSIEYYAVGPNNSARWDKSEYYSLMTLNYLSSIEIIQQPIFKTEKDLFKFEVKIQTNEEIEFVTKLINHININSLNDSKKSFSLINNKIALEKLETLDIENIEKYLNKKINHNTDYFNSFFAKEWLEKELLGSIYKLKLNKENFDSVEFIDKYPSIIEINYLYENNELALKIVGKYGFKHLQKFSYSDNIKELFEKAFELNKSTVSFSEKEWENISWVIDDVAKKDAQWFKESVLPGFDQKTLKLALEIEKKEKSYFKKEKLIEVLELELNARESENIIIDFLDNSGQDNQESNLGGGSNSSDDE